MADNCLKLHPNINTFSAAIKYYMRMKKISRRELQQESNLSRTTIGRMCRNSNDKGSTYRPPIQVIWAVSVGLKLTHAEMDELFRLAYPESEFMGEILDNHLTMVRADILLAENNCPLLGNSNEK